MGSAAKIINSRTRLTYGLTISRKIEAEGGCGVVGAACTTPITGRHILNSLIQMKNRGNGKGGGIAALGLSPEKMGVSRKILEEDYLLQVAFLDPSSRNDVENQHITPHFDIDANGPVGTVGDYRALGLEVRPPEVYRYFCRVKPDVLGTFIQKNNLEETPPDSAEDEFVYQNSYSLNRKFYASLGDKKAFVLSHGKNMLVLKLVGYGDQVIRYYKLEDFPAHVWIGHHRYPTKGKVWHPGGAHPFIGLHEALVHNGDFSNYYSITEYLAQQNMYPLFLTDTEVAVYLFDLWRRVYGYPTEYVIEALAPTTERDFLMLPEERRRSYREIQLAHIHGSPDGPWFFIVGRTEPNDRKIQLVGITDTSMLRPQVFALQEGQEKIGLIASERQAIDALLRSLSSEDERFAAKADLYWNARGGSYNDGGAFIFTVNCSIEKPSMSCTDKFGREIPTPSKGPLNGPLEPILGSALRPHNDARLLQLAKRVTSVSQLCESIKRQALDDSETRNWAVNALTMLLDRLHLISRAKDGKIRESIEETLFHILRGFPPISKANGNPIVLVDRQSSHQLRAPASMERALVVDVADFQAEGEESASAFIVEAYRKGWRHIYSFDWRGQRFCGCGLGSDSRGFRLDVYGNPGDYLGSGLDGAEIYVHAAAQDQVAQIMKSGKLVIYGDVGQTFMYGAKGGEVFVLGNAAGRPLINAVGKPRVVINGTCLDYLAESFMAGDPLKGGGFVILNGLEFDQEGKPAALLTPYAGGNLFSLASGGAIYLRDPNAAVGNDQLNGGRFGDFSEADWDLIRPYLEENERLFGILTESEMSQQAGGSRLGLYRKIEAVLLKALTVARN